MILCIIIEEAVGNLSPNWNPCGYKTKLKLLKSCFKQDTPNRVFVTVAISNVERPDLLLKNKTVIDKVCCLLCLSFSEAYMICKISSYLSTDTHNVVPHKSLRWQPQLTLFSFFPVISTGLKTKHSMWNHWRQNSHSTSSEQLSFARCWPSWYFWQNSSAAQVSIVLELVLNTS